MPPVIAVTSWSENRNDKPTVEINRAFVDGVVRAGGVPLVVPVLDPAMATPVAASVDGVLLTGGIDVSPGVYGADRSPHVTKVDEARDSSEMALVDAALSAEIPVLGLCRGQQLLNVARGGTLIQHLPEVSDQPHEVREHPDRPAHGVRVAAGSSLAEAVGGRADLQVNTLHHQAVDRLGEGLSACAWADDEVVEAVEDTDRKLLGVQWHPELMLDHPEGGLALFTWLVGRASGD